MADCIEKEFSKYNQLKIDLLKVSKCIECCKENEKGFYQEIAFSYSTELKKFKKFIGETYGINLCDCCCMDDKCK